MKLTKPENSNYCATVVEIKNIIPLDNCDNVVQTSIFGLQAIVGKEVKVGDIGVFFPVETQLSEQFCAHNNLYPTCLLYVSKFYYRYERFIR
jgi:hypothetical protein